MYQRTNSDGFANMEYGTNANLFLEFAYSKEGAIDKRVTKHGRVIYDIKCPCFKCQNVFYRSKATIRKHLLGNGFMDNYTKWHVHGETSMHDEGQSSTAMEVDDGDDDGYQRMVLDSMPPSDYNPTHHANLSSDTLGGHTPNPEAKGFYDMLQAADEPLWEGKKATNCSKLEAATNFLNWKPLFNVSTEYYNHILSMVKAMMPEENKLPESFYDTKKILQKLSLPKERINTAKDMTWHHDHKTKDGSMVHPSDGKAWKHFDSINPDFANEIRNVRLGLCTDGFNPNNSNSNPFSLWPIFLTVYNLPPWMSLKDSFINLSLVIPGRKSPGQNVDVFLRPLIDELKQLYAEGIKVFDAYRKENFMMKAILLWTVSDFPAYAMLSGWSTHGNLACPYCMGDTQAFRLHVGGKPSSFDCHRRFLPSSHPFRSDKNGFRDNKSVPSSLGPPPKLTGQDLYKQVFSLPTVYEDDNVTGDDDNDTEDVQHFFQENERLVCSEPADNMILITHAETNLIKEVDDVNIDDDQSGSEFEHIDLDDGDEEYDDEDSD
ncbi:hypothetical protein E3N88_00606 [Mikania micrantha]|uniref:Transposase-associated domain-containing protein n=1 Tax=Mikania micrantha TaxID=192012 RepID=A0A5N6Q1A0_9ASTR|nr:hypothetical protein E3N88_00606 [Mikania micrantha]